MGYRGELRCCRAEPRPRLSDDVDKQAKPETSQAVPTTPDEHFAWWRANTDVPYGTCWCGCGQPRRYISGEAAITLLPADA